jgi:hypothetical protein
MTRPVRIHPAGPEWFAACTDADWSQGGVSCNWYGEYRTDKRDAEADAARHRRSHR